MIRIKILSGSVIAATLFGMSPHGLYAVLAGEHHRRVACSRCGVPAHPYGEDVESQRAAFIAIGDGAPTVKQQRWTPTNKGPVAVTIDVRKKTFVVPVRDLQVDSVTLDSIGLVVYSDGTIHATGRLLQQGGPAGDLLTRSVVVHLRAIAWIPIREGQPASAPVVWSTDKRLRVHRNSAQFILVADRDRAVPELFRHFDAITHFEVELECRRDR